MIDDQELQGSHTTLVTKNYEVRLNVNSYSRDPQLKRAVKQGKHFRLNRLSAPSHHLCYSTTREGRQGYETRIEQHFQNRFLYEYVYSF